MIVLPEGCQVKCFVNIREVPTSLVEVNSSSGQWVKRNGDEVQVTCLVDLAFVASPLHLHTGMFRTYNAHLLQQTKSSLGADLWYQLGGNRNVSRSIGAFSPKPSSTALAVVCWTLTSPSSSDALPLSAVEGGFEDLCACLAPCGQETACSSWTQADTSQVVQHFKLQGPQETSSPQRIEQAVLTRVAMKDC